MTLIKSKEKACKGTGKAKGEGCGNTTLYRRNGLCNKCYPSWYFSTEKGKQRVLAKAHKEVKEEENKEWRERKAAINNKGSMNSADIYFSRYIRLLHSEDGLCTCYTCGMVLPIKEIENGHFMKREHKTTRYHENNCRPQCKTCNGDTKHNGKQLEFEENLINEIGITEVYEIKALSKQTVNASAKFFRDISDQYRIKVNELQKKLGVKFW
jgi:hypothetical protein